MLVELDEDGRMVTRPFAHEASHRPADDEDDGEDEWES
jgi:hypothetical protein